MKFFPDVELPRLFCEYQNYTVTFEWLSFFLFIFSAIGFFYTIFLIYKLIRLERKII